MISPRMDHSGEGRIQYDGALMQTGLRRKLEVRSRCGSSKGYSRFNKIGAGPKIV